MKVNAIAFVGNMAQVRFEKAVIPLNKSDMQPAPQRYIATIAYVYKIAGKEEKDRLINPLGFQITSYRVDKDADPMKHSFLMKTTDATMCCGRFCFGDCR